MKPYIFSLLTNDRETYREELLALTDGDAVDLAVGVLSGMDDDQPWTIAMMTDVSGQVVWALTRAEGTAQ